jgi:aminoglycoside phosphotransferase (APT) family kinase protein
MTVRLPSAAPYALQVEKERRWLAKLAPFLRLPIPVPLAMGAPTEFYPLAWSVYQWIEGANAAIAPVIVSGQSSIPDKAQNPARMDQMCCHSFSRAPGFRPAIILYGCTRLA